MNKSAFICLFIRPFRPPSPTPIDLVVGVVENANVTAIAKLLFRSSFQNLFGLRALLGAPLFQQHNELSMEVITVVCPWRFCNGDVFVIARSSCRSTVREIEGQISPHFRWDILAQTGAGENPGPAQFRRGE